MKSLTIENVQACLTQPACPPSPEDSRFPVVFLGRKVALCSSTSMKEKISKQKFRKLERNLFSIIEQRNHAIRKGNERKVEKLEAKIEALQTQITEAYEQHIKRFSPGVVVRQTFWGMWQQGFSLPFIKPGKDSQHYSYYKEAKSLIKTALNSAKGIDIYGGNMGPGTRGPIAFLQEPGIQLRLQSSQYTAKEADRIVNGDPHDTGQTIYAAVKISSSASGQQPSQQPSSNTVTGDPTYADLIFTSTAGHSGNIVTSQSSSGVQPTPPAPQQPAPTRRPINSIYDPNGGGEDEQALGATGGTSSSGVQPTPPAPQQPAPTRRPVNSIYDPNGDGQQPVVRPKQRSTQIPPALPPKTRPVQRLQHLPIPEVGLAISPRSTSLLPPVPPHGRPVSTTQATPTAPSRPRPHQQDPQVLAAISELQASLRTRLNSDGILRPSTSTRSSTLGPRNTTGEPLYAVVYRRRGRH